MPMKEGRTDRKRKKREAKSRTMTKAHPMRLMNECKG